MLRNLGNTYNSGVQVRSKKGDDSEIIRSGNTQRGIGYDEVSLYDYDIFTNNGAVLSGTMSKLTVSAATNGSVEFVDGYYRVDGNDVYALPYSVSNQLTRIKGTSGVDYDSPAITITPTGAAAISPTSTTTGSDATTGADNATWSIQMPDVDATAAVTFPIDLGNDSCVFTIADFTYNGSGQAVTEIKTKKTSTSTNEITLSLTDGDITFVDYLSSTGETIGPNPPSAAGNYKISIKTGNKTIGSCEVAYKINAATATITAGDQKVTYTGAGQAYSGVTNCPGSYSVTYYPSETDRTNNSNGYTTPLPVNAGDYFVKVTQTDPNYTSSPVDAKFTIEAIEAQFTWGTTQFDYDGNPHVPTASVSNIVDGDACSVTVSGQQTNVGSSYTATISGLGSTNYKLPATAPSTTFSINPIAVGLSWTNTSFTFDGDAHKPTATATGLVGSDVCNVTVTGEQTNASATSYTATATALDNNNYKLPTTGLTQDFTISPCSLATATIATIDAQTYSGSEIKPTPEVKITLGTSTTPTTLKAEDFDYSYANNKNAALSTATPAPTVTITGKGNYKGSSSKTFTILPKSVEGLTVTLSGTGFDSDKKSFVYNGQMQTPTVTVKDGDKLLVLNTDYTLVNNGGVGAADDYDVVVTGTGNYDSNTSVTVTYSIAPKSIASAVITLSSTSSAFNGDTQVPTISSVSLDNVPLTPDVDYTVKSNAGGKDVGTYDVVIQGKGNYDAATTAQKTFTIVPCSVAVVTIDAIPAQTYNGSPITPVPTGFIMSGANKISLVVGTDFDCTSYANNTNAALSTDTPAPTVTITCKGNYYGTRNVPFTIDPVDLSKSTDITIDAVPDQIYTGSPITPTPEVKFNGNKLTAGTDFNYSYSNNTDEAQSTSSPAPTVTVTGMGNFKNSTSVKFTIEQEASIAFGTRNYITYYNEYAGNRLVPNNAKAYIVTGVNGNEVVVDQVSFITPFTPVLLEKSPGWTNVKDNVLHSGNLLKYATADVNTDGKQYVLYSGEFVKATGTIPAGKVYLELPSSPARTLVIGRNNAATGVDTISNEAADGEDKWYDMQGRQINKPSKTGLYIKNGKKVVVNNK